MEIYHNRINAKGFNIIKYEDLYLEDGETPKWIEHPNLGFRVDFVALPLTDLNDVQVNPYYLDLGEDIIIGVTEAVSVVGFLFGIQVGSNAAIWPTGTVAF
ncbi:hypothetical protein [Niallia sp. Krafla_26]|uniref:hypothetical protein n=1 Tax=Niallia sp. Krafla_26 TaxID=3064703 RepID=UPI003D1759AD